MSSKTVLIINRDDVLFVEPLRKFLETNGQHIESLYYTDFFPPQASKSQYLWKSLQIMGLTYILKYLFASRLVKLGKRASLVKLAEHYKLPCVEVLDVNSADFIRELRQKEVTTILSITSQLYGHEILALPNLRIYNFHPSLLPNNKGRFPLFWAILNGDQQGITCHEIDKTIDGGKIIYQEVINMPEGIGVPQAMDIILSQFPRFMEKSFSRIRENQLDFPHPNWEPFYGPTPKSSDIVKYRQGLNQ